MKSFAAKSAALLLLAVLVLSGCTYHGKIHRGIYKASDYEEKINSRVMVVADKFFQDNISTDHQGRYRFRLSDGLPVAVADALATVFTEVDVADYRHRMNYDYIVEIEYKAGLNLNSYRMEMDDVIYPSLYWHPTLYTYITLTVRNPKTGYAVARYSENAKAFMPMPATDGGLATTQVLKYITLGLATPLQIQVYGSKLRKLMEESIVHALKTKIMPRLYEDRINFTREHATEQTNTRVDGKFLPFMRSTVYIFNDEGSGSGFLISPDGYIITNAHVVGKARDVSVVLYDQQKLMDKTNPIHTPSHKSMGNKIYFGKVLKINRARDLALVKIEGENLPWMELETNRKVYTTGKEVVAIGAPRNIEWTVTQGVISAVRDKNGVDTIQTDTAINGGNSGGPLIDLKTGKVIGVNSWSRVPEKTSEDLQRGVQNLNFAISSFEVARTLGVTQPVDPDDFVHPED